MKAKFFMFLPMILLGLSFAGWGVMISKATSDPSFAVEARYYQKASLFEEELARRSASRKLGWHIEVLEFRRTGAGALALTARLTDRQGTPLSSVRLSVEALANLRSAAVQHRDTQTDADGRAEWQLDAGAPGLWELRFVARSADDTFVQSVRVDLAERGGTVAPGGRT